MSSSEPSETVSARPPDTGPGDSRSRLAYLDRLRVAAAMTVVMIHVAAAGWYDTPPASADWQAMNVYDSLSRWSVPAFFMISGALFLSPGRSDPPSRIWRRNISRLLVMYLFWSAVYTVLGSGIQHSRDPRYLLQHLWDGHYHLWYLPAMAGVYALVPLLQRIVESRELARYFVLITGVASVLVPTLGLVPLAGHLSADLVSRVAPFLVAGFPFYFVLGHLLHEYGQHLPRWLPPTVYASAAVGALVTIAGTAWISMGAGKPISLYGYLTLGVVAMSVGVFLAVRRAADGSPTSPRLVQIARWTLPIYLIHPAFLRLVQECHITPASLPAAVGIPLTWVIVLALSALASALLVRIPLANRWLV